MLFYKKHFKQAMEFHYNINYAGKFTPKHLNGSNGLYCKSFAIVIYNRNNSKFVWPVLQN